jgi:hypothetical protein
MQQEGAVVVPGRQRVLANLRGSLRLALIGLVVSAFFLNEPGQLPIGEPSWVRLLVRVWPWAEGLAALAIPLLIVVLAIRDYRAGARLQAIVAVSIACGIEALGVASFLPRIR